MKHTAAKITAALFTLYATAMPLIVNSTGIAFDTSGVTYTASGTQARVALAAAGANEIALICIEYGTSGSHALTSVQVGGSSTGVTQINSERGTSGRKIQLYYFLNPSTSSTNYDLNVNNTADDEQINVAFYTNALQSGQPDSNSWDTSSGNPAVNLNASTTVVATGSWVTSCFTGDNPSYTGGTGNTLRSIGVGGERYGDSNGSYTPGLQLIQWVAPVFNFQTSSFSINASIAPNIVSAVSPTGWGLIQIF